MKQGLYLHTGPAEDLAWMTRQLKHSPAAGGFQWDLLIRKNGLRALNGDDYFRKCRVYDAPKISVRSLGRDLNEELRSERYDAACFYNPHGFSIFHEFQDVIDVCKSVSGNNIFLLARHQGMTQIKFAALSAALSRLASCFARARDRAFAASLRMAAREQNLESLARSLELIVPDISDQYSYCKIDTPDLALKIRLLHAFQIQMALQALDQIDPAQDPVQVVDIGDSAGAHLRYLKGLYRKRNLKCLSVNIDPAAVEKIRAGGSEAVVCRAEDLAKLGVQADLAMSFEMVEHLTHPIGFFRNLYEKTKIGFILLTVPYVRTSQAGLHYIREARLKKTTPEEVHVFELSPEDWKLLFKFTGWAVCFERIYRQYPSRGLYRMLRGLWRRYDYEGFYGVLIRRDSTWTELYQGWEM